MVVKDQDSIDSQVASLEKLLTQPGLTAAQRQQVTDELASVQRRHQASRAMAVQLDRLVKHHAHRVILHDLRIERDGKVMTCDHILINRMLQVYVVCTLNVSGELQVNDKGEFQLAVGKFHRPIPSPIAHAVEMAQGLADFVQHQGLTPKRLGMRLKPEFVPLVLLGPGCTLQEHAQLPLGNLVTLATFLDKYLSIADAEVPTLETVSQVFRTVKKDTIAAMAQALVGFHTPVTVDYRELFRIPPPASDPAPATEPAAEPANDEPANDAPQAADNVATGEAAEPAAAPAEPVTPAADDVATNEATEPAAEATEPATEATEPATEPAEPAAEPTEPTAPATEETATAATVPAPSGDAAAEDPVP